MSLILLCRSEGGGSEAGGDPQRPDIPVPPAGRLKHSQRNRNLWRPLRAVGEFSGFTEGKKKKKQAAEPELVPLNVCLSDPQ